MGLTRLLNAVLGLDTRKFEAGIDKALTKMNRFGRRMESTGRDLTTRVTLPIVGVGAAAVSAFAKFEGLTKGLEAIATAADPASKQMERLRKLALNPGISLEQAVAGSIRLQAVGQSAKEAEETLLQFSKAVALAGGTAQDLDVVTRQLSQIQSKGRILSEDFLVIAERIPAIGLAMQTAFGTKSIEAVRATGISAKEFVARLTDGIARTREFQNVTGGLANAFDNFKQSITAALVQLGETITKSINLQGILDKLSGIIQRMVERFRNLSPETQKFVILLAAALAAIGPLLIAIGSFAKVLVIAGSGLRTMLTPLNLSLVALGLFAAAVVKAYQESPEFRAEVQRLWEEIKILGDQLRPVAQEIRDIISEVTQGRGVFQTFTNAITDLTRAFADFLGGIRSLKQGFTSGGFRQLLGGLLDTTSFGKFAKFFGVDLSEKIRGVKTGSQDLRDALDPNNAFFEKIPAFVPGVKPKQTTPKGDSPFKPLSDASKGANKVLNTVRETIQEFQQLPVLNLIPEQIDRMGGAAERLAENNLKAAESFEQIRGKTEALNEYVNQVSQSSLIAQERFQAIAQFASGALSQAFGAFFDTLLTGGKNALGAFGDILKKIVAQLIKAAATALILSAVFSIFTGGTGKALEIFGFKGKGFGALFGGFFGKFSGFAHGGLVYGPTLGMIGEGSGTSRHNPEVIAPLDRLRSLLDGGGNYVATTRISGDDLLLLVERAGRKRGR